MIEFTELELEELIRDTLAPKYYQNATIQALYTFDDIVQDTIMWFYEPMRNGEQRLEHYRKTYDTKQHIINMIKFGLRQTIPAYSRYKDFKNIPASLSVPINSETDDEFIDLIESKDEPTDMMVALSQMIEQLSEKQKQVLNDIIAGQTKTHMREKYKDFDDVLEDIRDDIYLYYISSGEDIESEFNINYSLSYKGFKKVLKPLLQSRVKELYNKFLKTGNPIFYIQSKELERVTN